MAFRTRSLLYILFAFSFSSVAEGVQANDFSVNDGRISAASYSLSNLSKSDQVYCVNALDEYMSSSEFQVESLRAKSEKVISRKIFDLASHNDNNALFPLFEGKAEFEKQFLCGQIISEQLYVFGFSGISNATKKLSADQLASLVERRRDFYDLVRDLDLSDLLRCAAAFQVDDHFNVIGMPYTRENENRTQILYVYFYDAVRRKLADLNISVLNPNAGGDFWQFFIDKGPRHVIERDDYNAITESCLAEIDGL